VAPRIWTLELPQEFEFTSIKNGVFCLSDSVGFEFRVSNAVGFCMMEAYIPNYWEAEADLQILIRKLNGVETIISLEKEKVPASLSHSFLLVKLIVPVYTGWIWHWHRHCQGGVPIVEEGWIQVKVPLQGLC